MSYMNVEKQSKTLSTTGSQWITREHHSEQLRFLARKTNIWSNTSHSHATILLLEPLVYGGEISFKFDSTQGWIGKMMHFIEVNSTLPTRLWTPRNKGIKRISREVLKPRPRLNSKLKNPATMVVQFVAEKLFKEKENWKVNMTKGWPGTTMDHQRTNSLSSNGLSSFFLHLSFTSHCKKCYRAGTPESVLLRWIQDMELKTAPILALP